MPEIKVTGWMMNDRWKPPIHSFIFRLTLYLALVGALPFAAALSAYYRQSFLAAQEELVKQVEQSHAQSLQQLKHRLAEMKAAAETLASDEAVQRYMTSGTKTGADESGGQDQVVDKMRQQASRLGHVTQMCLLAEAAQRSVCMQPDADTASSEFAMAESGEAFQPEDVWDQNHRDYGIKYSMPVTDANSHAVIGRMIVVLNVSHLLDEIQDRRAWIGQIIFDRQGHTVYRRGTQPEIQTWTAAEQQDGAKEAVVTSQSIVSQQSFELDGERWTSRLEVENRLHAAAVRALGHAVILFLFLLALLCAGGALIFSRYITRPLGRLRELMKRAERGDLKAYWVSNHTQEINELGQSYNQMLNRLEDLIKQVKHEEALKKEAEIAALQYQLNPHFLYNTLNTIKWVAKLHKTPQISEVVSALVRLLQASLGKKGDFITLREEIGLIRDYMEIQRFRYGDRVQVNYEIEPVAELCLVPRMILQPLVENACIHGIEPSQRDGTITIRAWLDRDLLFCQVEDNGIGMKIDPESGERAGKTDALKERMSGIGLKNIREKIKLYYGPDYKMHVISKERQGTTVRLSLPIHQSEV